MTPPVLFLIFNRPDTTARVFEAIRQARPPRLYIAGDGPRADRPGETERCTEARRIATQVDWPCEVKTLFQEKNLGCRFGPFTGISWFFENEEEGIILEDDCLPGPAFFVFCGTLLERYRNDQRVMHITGDNFQESMGDYSYSYYFSRHMHITGWASWRRAWKHYDGEMVLLNEFLENEVLRGLSPTPGFSEYWAGEFRAVGRGLDAWDYGWTLSCWEQHGLSATPRANLVANIGYGPGGTHSFDSDFYAAHLPICELDFPLISPPLMSPHQVFDSRVDRRHYGIRPPAPTHGIIPLLRRIKRKLSAWLR